MHQNTYCVIMAGGLGTGFWPISRSDYPKQFIDILGTGESLLQQTYARFSQIVPEENIFVVTNEKYKQLVQDQLPNIHDNQVVPEPAKRDTAPCLAYASYKINNINPEANIIVTPSDHIITKENNFLTTIQEALDVTGNKDWILSLGIQPNWPETEYGYIQYDDVQIDTNNKNIYKVKTFSEKPDQEMARTFIESGDFLWNSGIFVANLNTWLNTFKENLPEVYSTFRSGIDKYNTPEEASFIKNAYTTCRKISIDYGIMEQADNTYVYASSFGWSDLGTWASLYNTLEKDTKGNSIEGKNVKVYDTENSLVKMPDHKLVILQGLKDYIVAEDTNTLLICKRDQEFMIRRFINDVKLDQGDQYL